MALYHKGKKVLSLYGGFMDSAKTQLWQPDTLTLIWSAGKGIATACLLHILQEKGIPLEATVATFWPEFAAAGKEKITIGQLLSHRAGLSALDATGLSLTDHDAVASALAAQSPNWNYDNTHGYGARTFGFLIDDLLRRLTDGEPLASYWRRVFAIPLNLDLWFGLPSEHLERTASVIPPKSPPPFSEFSQAYGDLTSLTRRTFAEPGGNRSLQIMNQSEIRQSPIISLGAIASAEALAKFYSILAMQEKNAYFHPTTLMWMQTPLAHGSDRVLLTETTFSAGFMMNNRDSIMGSSHYAFGRPGAGGALAFADPETELGFAYLPNAMHPGAMPGSRTQRLIEALMENRR